MSVRRHREPGLWCGADEPNCPSTSRHDRTLTRPPAGRPPSALPRQLSKQSRTEPRTSPWQSPCPLGAGLSRTVICRFAQES